MRDLRRNPSWIPFLLVFAVTAAGAAGRSEVPARFVPALDGAPVIADLAPGGAGLAAWAYRAGPEYDIAISLRDESGVWAPPQFIGALDGTDQLEPALAVDRLGNAYLAYSVRPAFGRGDRTLLRRDVFPRVPSRSALPGLRRQLVRPIPRRAGRGRDGVRG